MSSERSIRECHSKHAPIFGRVLRPVAYLLGVILAERDRTQQRFRSFGCWRRVLALGVMLAGLAGIPVVSLVIYGVNGSYFPGMASIFGGFLQALLIIRIASPDVYPDWIGMGVIDILIGVVLLFDPGLSTCWSLVGFGLCLAASALVRIWIGLTFREAGAFTFIGSSGLVGLFLLAWFLVVLLSSDDVRLDVPIATDLVLRADLLLRGAALIGFGLSLRNREP